MSSRPSTSCPSRKRRARWWITPTDAVWAMSTTYIPRVFALPVAQTVRARIWPVGSIVTLTVEDTDTVISPDYTGIQLVTGDPNDPNGSMAEFPLAGIVDLTPGVVLTMTDGTITKVHTVEYLNFNGIDGATDTFYGEADQGAVVQVRVWSGDLMLGQRTVSADYNNTWTANFSGQVDLLPEYEYQIRITDEDIDRTQIEGFIPDAPVHIVLPTLNINTNDTYTEIYGYGGSWGVPVTLTLVDMDSPAVPVFKETQTPNEQQPEVFFDLGNTLVVGKNIQATLSNEIITRTFTIPNLVITWPDYASNMVFGTAEPGAQVIVQMQEGYPVGAQWGLRVVNADGSGSWKADFNITGESQGEQYIVDILPGQWADASVQITPSDTLHYAEMAPDPRYLPSSAQTESAAVNFPSVR